MLATPKFRISVYLRWQAGASRECCCLAVIFLIIEHDTLGMDFRILSLSAQEDKQRLCGICKKCLSDVDCLPAGR